MTTTRLRFAARLVGLLSALALALVFTFAVHAPTADAHRTPTDRRTAKQCSTLIKPGKRAACLACVERKVSHHFHPKRAEGDRCHPSDAE